ncbi:acyl-CoA thioesterase [Streptomyces sp. NRRL B-24720]|uniref:acyl-CoA thioesterase n=1 Tax=Streptomyces sp. NRRL B-24720 TaxID=1476876 RepID=UPI00055B255C|nr:acyl-CoA thioesterase domain-containing protein [Streptomyces sp. NRRL B-24720]
MLALEPVRDDLWRGSPHGGRPPRAFGGVVLAQALLAAGRTVDTERRTHSLHAYFLRSVDPTGEPVEYRVDRLRDGSSYAARQVTAHQHGRAVLSLQTSFKRPEPGLDRQTEAPDAPPPEECSDPYEAMAREQPECYATYTIPRVLDQRIVAPSTLERDARKDELGRRRTWLRIAAPLPDEPMVHEAALAYLSDLTLSPTAALPWEPHGAQRGGRPEVMLASLDHSLWIHRPPRADSWLLYSQRTTRLADGRALTRGELWDQEHQLIATVAQEALLRRRTNTG